MERPATTDKFNAVTSATGCAFACHYFEVDVDGDISAALAAFFQNAIASASRLMR
jgi:hypothetical protein